MMELKLSQTRIIEGRTKQFFQMSEGNMLHTGKISKCLDVDAKQRQCGTLSQCSRVTKFETVLWVSTKGFSVLCGHLGLPGHFFS
jgi:hypothetical protein